MPSEDWSMAEDKRRAKSLIAQNWTPGNQTPVWTMEIREYHGDMTRMVGGMTITGWADNDEKLTAKLDFVEAV